MASTEASYLNRVAGIRIAKIGLLILPNYSSEKRLITTTTPKHQSLGPVNVGHWEMKQMRGSD